MKTIYSILASALICSVFFIPGDGATISTYVLWTVWSCFALFIANIIWKATEERSEK